MKSQYLRKVKDEIQEFAAINKSVNVHDRCTFVLSR